MDLFEYQGKQLFARYGIPVDMTAMHRRAAWAALRAGRRLPAVRHYIDPRSGQKRRHHTERQLGRRSQCRGQPWQLHRQRHYRWTERGARGRREQRREQRQAPEQRAIGRGQQPQAPTTTTPGTTS